MDEQADEAHLISFAEAAELRAVTLERTVSELRARVQEQQEKLAELASERVEIARKDVEVASLMSELDSLQDSMLDPEKRERLRIRHPRTRGRGRRETREELRTISMLEPLTAVTPALRFIAEITEAE